MTRFTEPVLAQLPPLPLGLDTYAALKEAAIAEITARLRANGFAFDVGMLETEPLVIASAEAGAGRLLLALTRRDDAVRSVLLAESWGPYLDQLGANQLPAVARKPVVVAPRDFIGFPEDWEADDDFRERIQLAPETLSTAGPEGAYVSGALAIPGVSQAAAYGPCSFGGTPLQPFTGLGEVHVVLVAADGDGSAPPEMVADVQAELRQEDRYPICDFITVSAAEMQPYQIEVVLKVGPGVVRSLAEEAATKRLALYAAGQRKPGGAARRHMIYSAAGLSTDGGANLVVDIDIVAPVEDVNGTAITPATPDAAYRAPTCLEIIVRSEVVDD